MGDGPCRRRGGGEGDVGQVLDPDAPIGVSRGGEADLHALIAGIADLRARPAALAGVVEVEGEVTFRRGREGHAPQGVEDPVF